MLQLLSRWPRLVGPALAVTLALLPAPAPGQPESKQLAEEAFLKARYLKSVKIFEELINGEREPSGAAEEEAIEAMAQWYVYQMTVRNKQTEKAALFQLQEHLQNKINNNVLKSGNIDKNRAAVKLFTARLTVCLKQVFDLDFVKNRVSIVNSAILLPIISKLRQEEFGDFATELLNDPKQHDTVKLYALKALRDYLPVRVTRLTDQDQPKEVQQKLKEQKERDLRRLKAVTDYLRREWKMPKDAPKEVEDVARFIRREAIQTLAQAGAPAVEVAKGKVEGAVAPHLLVVLTGKTSGMVPEPGLLEKCEAAIGLCYLNVKQLDDYQVELGAYLVAQFVAEFINEYQKDHPTFGGKLSKDDKDTRKLPLIAWKVQVDRLRKALTRLHDNLPAGNKTRDKLARLINEVSTPLGSIASHNLTSPPATLQARVADLRPPNGLVFRSSKEWEIRLPAAGGD
ncbi:MAG: hypothetical protein L0Z62_19245 [Gemmataceae bacterium]|nr:hypothetical protein [Gemmataceae bacterium]